MTILFSARFASSGLETYYQEAGHAQGLRLVADPDGVPGDVLCANIFTPGGAALNRSEISQTVSTTIAVGSEGWYWWETFIPADWVVGGNQAVIWQVHDSPDGGDPPASRQPPLLCQIQGDEVNLDSCAAISPVDDNQVKRLAIWREPLVNQKGRWVSWVLNITWNYTSAGAMTLWRDRRKVFSEAAQKNCYNDVVGVYPKFGIYVPDGLTGAIPSRTMYHRGLVVGDNSYNTFDEFMAAAGSSHTELEMVFPSAMVAA